MRRRSILGASAALAAAAAGGNLSARAQSDDGALPDAADALQHGQLRAAPDLAFADAAGRKLSLADFRGMGLVINIWATWCQPCVAEFPTLAALAPRLSSAKILVLPISIDFEGLRAVQPFYSRHHIRTLPILLDPAGTTTDALNASGVPITIIVTPGGLLAGQAIGAADWNTPRCLALLTRLAAGAKPDNPVQPV